MENIENVSLAEGKSTMGSILQTLMEVASKTSNVTVLGFVLEERLRDVDTGVVSQLLQQLGQGEHLQLGDVALGLGVDEVGDAVSYGHLVRENIEWRKIILVTTKKLDKTFKNTLHIFLILFKVWSEEVSVSGVGDAAELVTDRDGVEGRDELVPGLQRKCFKGSVQQIK